MNEAERDTHSPATQCIQQQQKNASNETTPPVTPFLLSVTTQLIPPGN